MKECVVHIVKWTTTLDFLASATTSTRMSTPITNARCAWASTRLSNALELKLMVVSLGRIGQEKKCFAAAQHRQPDLRRSADGKLPPLPPPLEPPQDDPQQAEQEDQTLCAAAVAIHGPPPPVSSYKQSAAACPTIPEGREWTEAPQEEAEEEEEKKPTCPRFGYHVPGNLWNIDIEDRFLKPGPSFLRHVTFVQSPNNPTYVDTRIDPVVDVRNLRRKATFENVAAHQRY